MTRQGDTNADNVVGIARTTLKGYSRGVGDQSAETFTDFLPRVCPHGSASGTVRATPHAWSTRQSQRGRPAPPPIDSEIGRVSRS